LALRKSVHLHVGKSHFFLKANQITELEDDVGLPFTQVLKVDLTVACKAELLISWSCF
jgi:hypothetical protein